MAGLKSALRCFRLTSDPTLFNTAAYGRCRSAPACRVPAPRADARETPVRIARRRTSSRQLTLAIGFALGGQGAVVDRTDERLVLHGDDDHAAFTDGVATAI